MIVNRRRRRSGTTTSSGKPSARGFFHALTSSASPVLSMKVLSARSTIRVDMASAETLANSVRRRGAVLRGNRIV
jgi:hypothetical protein